MKTVEPVAAKDGASNVRRQAAAMVEAVNGFHAGGSLHATDLARSAPSTRRAPQPTTARARISAVKPRREAPLGPPPARLAKGDVQHARGAHRSIDLIERLRNQHALDPQAATNDAMYRAAQKLQRHFMGCLVGVKAQDLNKVIATGGDGLDGEENWVFHFDAFRKACKLMGWSDANPKRGAGRIVVAVSCYEETVGDAAMRILGPGWSVAIKAAGMDRLREGLYALAVHWRLC